MPIPVFLAADVSAIAFFDERDSPRWQVCSKAFAFGLLMPYQLLLSMDQVNHIY
jgi:hypothetical protein